MTISDQDSSMVAASPGSALWRKFLRKKAGVVGFVMFLAAILAAVFAPQIAPYDPYEAVRASTEDVMAPPSAQHLFGQDEAGKDVLSSVLYGARVSLTVGFSASLIVIILGGALGMVAGFYRGRSESIIMRVVDFMLVIPALPLMLVIIAVLGRGLQNTILIIGLLSWAAMARVVRSEALSVRERLYVMRAKSIGVPPMVILIRHVMPQLAPLIFALAILGISSAILAEATLSFLGLGDPTLISWGSMLNRAFMRGAVTRGAWWYLVPPGLALAWVTLALTFLGTAIQEILNPRLESHHLFNENITMPVQKDA